MQRTAGLDGRAHAADRLCECRLGLHRRGRQVHPPQVAGHKALGALAWYVANLVPGKFSCGDGRFCKRWVEVALASIALVV